MKVYELIQVEKIKIDMKELIDEVINYLTAYYEPEDYHLIDSVDVEDAIESTVYSQNSYIIYNSDYDNWSEILSNIYHDMVEYINTNNVQHELISIIKDNAI